MSLFTDSDIVTADTLVQMDSEVTLVAKATKQFITMEGPGSICEQAWQECGRKILGAMQSYVSYPAQTGMPASHIAAVTNVGVPARTQSRVRLNQIVSGDSQYGYMKSQVELFVAYHALYLFYRDTASRLSEDRYEKKMNRYQDAATSAWNGLRTEGLPMVYQALAAPAAKHSLNSGTWDSGNLSATSDGGTLTEPLAVQVAVTYCDVSRGYVSQSFNGNAESGPSAMAKISIPAGKVLTVDITSLVPPNGVMDQVGLSQGAWTPLTATNWNLWVGLDAPNTPLFLQSERIPIATKTVTLGGDPLLSGSVLRGGQYPDLSLVFMNIAMRG